MADKRISELDCALSLESTDLLELAQVSAISASGYISKNAPLQDVGEQVVTGNQYENLDTTANTITGAINELVNDIDTNTEDITALQSPNGWTLPQLGVPFTVRANGIGAIFSTAGKNIYVHVPYPYPFNKPASKVSITSIRVSVRHAFGGYPYMKYNDTYTALNDVYIWNNGTKADGVNSVTISPLINGFECTIAFDNVLYRTDTGTTLTNNTPMAMFIEAVITINE